MQIVVFSKTDCPYCTRTKEYLAGHGLPYTEKLLDDFDQRQAMYDSFGLVHGKRTVPQIVIDSVRIGGYTELLQSDVVARHRAGTFDAEF